jgi:hypothetical protein
MSMQIAERFAPPMTRVAVSRAQARHQRTLVDPANPLLGHGISSKVVLWALANPGTNCQNFSFAGAGP